MQLEQLGGVLRNALMGAAAASLVAGAAPDAAMLPAHAGISGDQVRDAGVTVGGNSRVELPPALSGASSALSSAAAAACLRSSAGMDA